MLDRPPIANFIGNAIQFQPLCGFTLLSMSWRRPNVEHSVQPHLLSEGALERNSGGVNLFRRCFHGVVDAAEIVQRGMKCPPTHRGMEVIGELRGPVLADTALDCVMNPTTGGASPRSYRAEIATNRFELTTIVGDGLTHEGDPFRTANSTDELSELHERKPASGLNDTRLAVLA